MNQTEATITVPLESKDLRLAKQFAEEQENTEKGQAVFINTLAVSAVHTYLNWVEITSTLDLSYSWHPVHRVLENVADLYLPEYGRLECCPVLPNEEVLRLPATPLDNRIGYVWVKFSESLAEVELLGFLPPTKPGEALAPENLQPMKGLLQHLFRLDEAKELLEERLQSIQSGNDPVFERVRETLKRRSISEMAASFEMIYRTEEDYTWAEKGGDELMGKTEPEMLAGGSVRNWERDKVLNLERGEEDEEDIEADIQYLATDLLEELQELWRDED